MQMNKPVSVGLKRVGIVVSLFLLYLVLQAGVWWHANPIRWHQKVQMAGVTVPVPFGWVVQTVGSQARPIEDVFLRRAPVLFGPKPWMTASFSRGLRGGEPFTVDSARREQAWFAAMYQNAAYYANPRTFDLSAGKYNSLCAEATMHGPVPTPTQDSHSASRSTQLLTCAVVGTPLSFNFMSPNAVDQDAEKMLASLN